MEVKVMSYNTKNYTEQGGDKTVIGGTLEILEGATVKGLPLPIAENLPESTVESLDALKEDFNSLLINLKDAGMMKKDKFTTSVVAISNPTGESLTANHSKIRTITYDNNIATIDVPINELVEFDSNPVQGIHKWIGLSIGTGRSSIIGVTYNGTYDLVQADVTEATNVGCPEGSFVLWLKCDEVINTPKIITISRAGYTTETITFNVIDSEN
jgi:hypothetical protein